MLSPRPQFARESILMLDGIWNLQTDQGDGQVNVPFSPESKLSGFPKPEGMITRLTYSRDFELPLSFKGRRLILNFIAVDQCCQVYVNGSLAFSHEGGYLPFCGEISQFIDPDGKNTIRVEVQDTLDETGFGYGKQSRNPHGIWYTPQSGIWQSVWLESVPLFYIDSLWIDPDLDRRCVTISVRSEFEEDCIIELDGKGYPTRTNQPTEIQIENPKTWSPEHPFLYPLTITMGEDRVTSYFGMRKFSVSDGRLYLNNKPYFHSGVLDQGYYQDGLYTPPDDETMKQDIQLMKDMGFNTLRKHIKVESPRWYYYCDTIGMLVWQDLPSGGTRYNKLVTHGPVLFDINFKDSNYSLFARKDPKARENCLKELQEMVIKLHNCPCIAMWVPFNEGWGQFDSVKASKLISQIDSSRTIDNTSGWHDQYEGQFKSSHVYFRPYVLKKDKKGRCIILSEFGGYNCAIEGHTYSETNFGYKRISNSSELEAALTSLYENQIIPARKQRLAACIYTQLSDVETEQNGLVTYDRKVVKVNPSVMKKINEKLISD